MLLNQKLSLCFENWSQRKGFGDREKGCSSQDSMLHVQIPNRILWFLNPLKTYFISSELISKVNGNEFPNKFILGNIFFCIENKDYLSFNTSKWHVFCCKATLKNVLESPSLQ